MTCDICKWLIQMFNEPIYQNLVNVLISASYKDVFCIALYSFKMFRIWKQYSETPSIIYYQKMRFKNKNFLNN